VPSFVPCSARVTSAWKEHSDAQVDCSDSHPHLVGDRVDGLQHVLDRRAQHPGGPGRERHDLELHDLVLSGTCANGFCTSSTTFTGNAIGVGAHILYFKPTGPGGTGSCSASVYVGALGPPTCNVTVTPSIGYLTTQYVPTWSTSSDATSCSWTFNGVNQGPQACSGTQSTNVPSGTTLCLVASNPSGDGTCCSTAP
jgi:hypothetical protein